MRPVETTKQEITDRIKELKVVGIKSLTDNLHCSEWTLFNKLRGLYYTSYNFQRQYITLKQIPIFDENGLWEYNKVRFSKWGNVEETIRQIVEQSPIGFSAGSIAKTLKIRTHNQLLKCRKKGLLVSVRDGRNQIYYSANEKKRANQISVRKKMKGDAHERIKQKLPSNKTIIDILLVMIQHCEKRSTIIVNILTSMGKRVSERDVEWVINEYGIKKNSCKPSGQGIRFKESIPTLLRKK
ncbi:MAG: hypothetical protein ABH950_04265 [Candidatus Altiarchaeota archaeon]